MKPEHIIPKVLEVVRKRFYEGANGKYMRDHAQLTKSIARYGFECANRNLDLTAQFIVGDLSAAALATKTDFSDDYLPVRIENAIALHVNGSTYKNTPTTDNPVKFLSDLYKQLHTASKLKRAPAQGKQMSLL